MSMSNSLSSSSRITWKFVSQRIFLTAVSFIPGGNLQNRAIVDEFIFTGNNLEICSNANKICNVIISVSGLKSTGLVKYSLP